MQMNPGIILAGQSPDVVGSIGKGLQLAQMQGDFDRQNALAGLYQQQGPGIMAGDPNALNALARFDPSAALGVQQTRQGMAFDQEKMQMARDQAAARVAEFSQRATAEQRAEMRDTFTRGANMIAAATTPEAFNQLLQAPGVRESIDAILGPGMATFENRQIIMAAALGAKEAVELSGGGGGNQNIRASEIFADGTVLTVTDAGPRVQRPDGTILTGPDAIDAIRIANDEKIRLGRESAAGRMEGSLGAQIALGGEAERSKNEGKFTAQAAQETYADFVKAERGLSNIETAIAAIDSGAQAGLVAKQLPNISLASASLKNAMDRMGLDVIASVTFGALSEAEMELAMQTAVPRDLQPAELRQWLVQKRDAQVKAADALLEAADYLSTPGNSLGTWTRELQRRRRDSAQPAPAPAPAPVAAPTAAPAPDAAPIVLRPGSPLEGLTRDQLMRLPLDDLSEDDMKDLERILRQQP